jgi:hypothetical protein
MRKAVQHLGAPAHVLHAPRPRHVGGVARRRRDGVGRPAQPRRLHLQRTTLGLQPRVDALAAQQRKTGVQQLLAEANRTATFAGACTAPAFAGMTPPAQRYCFDAQDTGPVGGDDQVEWIPQGVTTVADAQQDELWGSSQALLVSWYDKRSGPRKGVRITFLEPNTPGRVARWPLDGASGLLMPGADGRVHATDAYRLPDHNVQGAVSYAGTWCLSRSHGQHTGQLLLAKPDASPPGHAADDRRASGCHRAGGPLLLARAQGGLDRHRARRAACALRRAGVILAP